MSLKTQITIEVLYNFNTKKISMKNKLSEVENINFWFVIRVFWLYVL